jgi:hypothetical protein
MPPEYRHRIHQPTDIVEKAVAGGASGLPEPNDRRLKMKRRIAARLTLHGISSLVGIPIIYYFFPTIEKRVRT